MISRLFQFEKKIGWGELIGLVAIVFAGLSLYLQIVSNKADIVLINDQLIAGNFIDEDNSKKYFGLYRALISNNGNKAVSLIGLKPHKHLGLIVTTEKGSTKVSKDKIPFKIFLIPDSVTSREIDEKKIKEFKDQGLERLSRLNVKIEPGQMYVLTIGVIFDIYSSKNRVYESMIFTSELHFSNGQTINFGAGGKIEN